MDPRDQPHWSTQTLNRIDELSLSNKSILYIHVIQNCNNILLSQ